MPVVIGALGSVSRDLEESLVLIGLEEWIIPILQKTVLLNTVHILRHFLTHSATCLSCKCMYICYIVMPKCLVGIGMLYTRLPFLYL